MTRILITGAGGLLGINLALVAAKKYEVVGVVHERPLNTHGFETIPADLLESDSIARVLDESRADWVINCAALANLDTCEREPDFAQRMNAELPGRLAAETAKRKLRFLHISTDAVYDGVKGNYREEDSPAPINVYGRTKRLGELAVRGANLKALIVRPNFFGWSLSGDRSLAEFFYNDLSLGKSVSGYTDRLFCPLLATDLAAILLELLEKDLSGHFHVVSADSISKYDFGIAIAKRFALDTDLVKPASTGSNNRAAPRSPNLTLSTSKLSKVLAHRPPTVVAGIERFWEQYQSGYRDSLRVVGVSEMVKA